MYMHENVAKIDLHRHTHTHTHRGISYNKKWMRIRNYQQKLFQMQRPYPICSLIQPLNTADKVKKESDTATFMKLWMDYVKNLKLNIHQE